MRVTLIPVVKHREGVRRSERHLQKKNRGGFYPKP